MSQRFRLARSTDRYHYLDEALLAYEAGHHKLALRYLALALQIARMGQDNEDRGLRKHRRGRRQGSFARNEPNSAVLAWMDQYAQRTGEHRPHTLARLAKQESRLRIRSTQRTLADKWRRRVMEK